MVKPELNYLLLKPLHCYSTEFPPSPKWKLFAQNKNIRSRILGIWAVKENLVKTWEQTWLSAKLSRFSLSPLFVTFLHLSRFLFLFKLSSLRCLHFPSPVYLLLISNSFGIVQMLGTRYWEHICKCVQAF